MNLVTSVPRRTSVQEQGARPSTPSDPGLALRDILTTVFIRWRLIVLAFLAPVAVALATAALMPLRWPAEGLLMVQVSRETVGATDLTGTGPNVVSIDMPKVVQSEVDLLVSDVVLRRALSGDGLRAIFPDAGAPRLFGLLPAAEVSIPQTARRLRASMMVLSSNTSNLLRVLLALPDSDRAVDAMQRVFDAYLAHRQSIFAQADAQLLSAETERMATNLRELDEAIARLRTETRILHLPQDIELANARIASIVTRIDTLRERKAATDAQLRAARAGLSTYPARVVAASETTNLAPNDESRNELTRLVLERRRMADQYAPDWPPLRDLDQRIATLRQSIAGNRNTRFETVRQVRNPAVEQLSLRIATLEVEADATGRQMSELERQAGEAEARAAALLRAEATLNDMARRRDALDASFRQVAGREIGARIGEDARRSRSPSVIVAQPPLAAAQPRDLRLALIVMGLVGGLVSAGATAVLLTLFRRTFATTDEAARGLGLPGLASVPPAARLAGGNATPAVTDLTAMLLDARERGERLSLIQFVATGEDDGRGAIALAMAAEAARTRGLRTLLADLQTDGRVFLAAMGSHPVHEPQDPEQLLAFNTVLPNLWVAYGARSSLLGDPHAGMERTLALLNRLRQDLDLVILVAPMDSEGYAMRRLTALVDANVLALRADGTDKSAARAARDAVLAAGGRLVGFVMSGERAPVPARLARLVA